MSEFYKSVGEILGENNWVKVAKDLGSLYPNAQLPDNFDASNPYVATAGQLMNDARMIVAIHENSTLHQNGVPPLVDEDYIVLAQKHGDLAEQHRQFAMQLQAANPTGYIQAISGHGDAYGAHLDAQRVAFMMAPVVVDQHWDGKHGQILPARWNNENKVWRAAHRAFLMSQQAFNRTSFDTGVAKSMGESLADVIRHDQDHDDWHAMHGDPPCKSEADCARMRAKYSEVKAETGVAKGDSPGHPFRGNQWTSLGEKAAALHDAVQKLSLSSTPEEIRSLARVHQGLAFQHVNVVSQHEEMPYLTTPQEIGAEAHQDLTNSSYDAQGVHDEAANAHQEAAAELNHVAEMIESGASQGSLRLAMKAAKVDSLAATDASRQADKTSLPHPVGDPEFRDHEAKMLAEALGKSVDFTKGDVAGHAFHGNQYFSTVNGNTANDLSDSSKDLYRSARLGGSAADHEEMSREHAHLAEEHKELAEQAYSERNEFLGDAHRKAEGAHEDAGAFHTAAAQALAQDSPDYEELKQEAEVESGRAAEASGEAAREDAR